jgi:hypothetical protein
MVLLFLGLRGEIELKRDVKTLMRWVFGRAWIEQEVRNAVLSARCWIVVRPRMERRRMMLWACLGLG